MKMKRKLALLTSAVMLLGSLNVTAFAATGTETGDVNGDEKITAEDAELVMKYVLDPTSLTDEEKAAVEADGNVATDCDDADYTASNGTVIDSGESSKHGISAKDAAYILQKSLLSVYVNATAGTLDEDGNEISSYKLFGFDGSTTAEAVANAQAELAEMTVHEFFEAQAKEYETVGESAISRVNTFLNKVYINDDALSSKECRAWLENYLNVNGNADNFFNTFYSLVDYSTEEDGEFNVKSKSDIETMYSALEQLTISESDLNTILNRIDGTAALKDGTTEAAWLRTTFMVSVYDYKDGEKTVVDNTSMMNDYRTDTSYSTFDWYNLNNADSTDKTTEQPFVENFANFIKNYLYPMSVAINGGNGKAVDLINALGGDRVEITSNEGTLPDERYVDLYNSLSEDSIDLDDYLVANSYPTKDELSSGAYTAEEVETILDAYYAYVVSVFAGFDVELIDFTTYLTNAGKTIDDATTDDYTAYETYAKDYLTTFRSSLADDFNASFDDPTKTMYVDFSEFGYDF
ncbi:MAG: dockerin type I domain-containing protein [Clostridiales bacterium]|nr:dockerin type I domain-containing protein [Clostridiales bacterium]